MDNGGRVGAESAAMSCVDSTPGRNLKACRAALKLNQEEDQVRGFNS